MQEFIPAALVHRIADFTGQRDEAMLHSTLLAAAQELFNPQWCALYAPAEGEEYGTRANPSHGHGECGNPPVDSGWARAEFVVALHEGRRITEPGRPLFDEAQAGGALKTAVVAPADSSGTPVADAPAIPVCPISGFPVSPATPFAAGLAHLAGVAGVTILPVAGRSRRLLGYLALRRDEPITAQERGTACDLFRIYDNTLGLLREAHFDRLTGLLNRHTFETQLDRALDLARRTSRSGGRAGPGAKPVRFFLGELDIDHFKSVNDRFGHLYGDEVLLLVARMLKQNFRKSDLVFRFGGEEFVVILVADSCEGAALAMDRARRTIEEHLFPQVGHVTISVGLTEIRESDAPVQILGQADQALYYAKAHGRNQVCCYETLLAGGELSPYQATEDVTIF